MTVTIYSVLDRFSAFYHAAAEADPAERWRLWKEHYRFIPVEDGRTGDRNGRRRLDEAWPKYRYVQGRIRRPRPQEKELNKAKLQIEQLLAAESGSLPVIHFVGFFEKASFIAPLDKSGTPALCLPVEIPLEEAEWTRPLVTAVHIRKAGLSIGTDRTLARRLIEDGLALHVTALVMKQRGMPFSAGRSRQWADQCARGLTAIFRAARPRLNQSHDLELLYGPQGVNGEADEGLYLAWVLLDFAVQQGWTFSQIASASEDQLPQLTADFMDEYRWHAL
ncbi:hypothetical protein [Alkalicoccus chagannorensis]|uniref:hypothetical protein n=1 Tax=Alkalicoccus chagannorensis TaxID=427072 RepID=UPI000425E195|nr:hypothetical protein [Alkalicoccus chagannorensis]